MGVRLFLTQNKQHKQWLTFVIKYLLVVQEPQCYGTLRGQYQSQSLISALDLFSRIVSITVFSVLMEEKLHIVVQAWTCFCFVQF